MKRSSSPTSLDVARLAGVSRSIVSGVLNGTMSTMRVSAETRERVLAAAQELGYTPNPVARALRRQRSNVIGFVPRADRVTPYDSPVPFLLTVHLAQAGMEHGYHILEESTKTSGPGHTEDLVRVLLGRHVDGIVLDSPESAAEVARILDRGVPVVQVIRPQRAVRTPSVMIDAAPGTAEAIRYLLEMGHREIGFIGTSGAHPVDRARLDAFVAVLKQAGIKPREEWIILVDAYSSRFGRDGAERLLAAATRPTALFIAGDNLASGALQVLYERQIRIPDDLSVVSYDDLFAEHLVPPLMSVNQPLQEAANRAVELLIAQIEAKDGSAVPEPVVLPTHLVRRHSVRRITEG